MQKKAYFAFVCFSLLFAAVGAEIAGWPFSDGAAQCSDYSTNYPLTTSTYYTNQDVATCTPGQMTSQATTDYQRVINMFRRFAGLDPVTSISTTNEPNAQACALMCRANNKIQHTGWGGSDLCVTTAGTDGCASSNLAAGVSTPNGNIDLWLNDGGIGSLGHRRWILNPSLGNIAMGMADSYAALYVFGTQSYSTARGYYSWPPQGVTPLAAFSGLPMTWHYADVNFTSAPSIVSCEVLDQNCQNVVSGSCTADGPGYGDWGVIMFPTSVTSAGCYTVILKYRTYSGGPVITRQYIANLWDCSQTNGGSTCFANQPVCQSQSSAATLASWVNF